MGNLKLAGLYMAVVRLYLAGFIIAMEKEGKFESHTTRLPSY
jgi:hypothetical protein